MYRYDRSQKVRHPWEAQLSQTGTPLERGQYLITAECIPHGPQGPQVLPD